MPSHFSSIGFPIDSQEDLEALSRRLLPECEEIAAGNGTYLLYSSPCGAQLWFHVDGSDAIVAITPALAATTTIRIGVTAVVTRPGDKPMERALHAWAEPKADGSDVSGLYPFVFDCADYGTYGTLALPLIRDARIAAFAHELAVYESAEEHERSQPEGGTFASQSFVPSGLFAPNGVATEPPESFAIFTGHVRSAEERTNPTTGARYLAAEVDTLGGSFHVVADPTLVTKRIVPGAVVSGSFWLCGRLVEPSPSPSGAKKGFLGRLFAR